MLNYQRGVVSKTQIPNDIFLWVEFQPDVDLPLRVAADLIEELTRLVATVLTGWGGSDLLLMRHYF